MSSEVAVNRLGKQTALSLFLLRPTHNGLSLKLYHLSPRTTALIVLTGISAIWWERRLWPRSLTVKLSGSEGVGGGETKL